MENIINTKEEAKIMIDNKSEHFLVERINDTSLSKKDIVLQDNSRASYIIISDSPESGDVWRRNFILGENSQLSVRYLFLGENKQAWHIEHDLGDRARIDSRSLVIGKESQEVTVRADYDFRGVGTFGRVLADAAISGNSHLRYDANIDVLPLAQKSDTRVDLHLRLSGKQARGEMTPGLNIAANDVKAGHSASTFQLSPEDLFYLRSRGLSPEEIAKMFAFGMANNFVRGIDNKDLKSEILDIIREKL